MAACTSVAGALLAACLKHKHVHAGTLMGVMRCNTSLANCIATSCMTCWEDRLRWCAQQSHCSLQLAQLGCNGCSRLTGLKTMCGYACITCQVPSSLGVDECPSWIKWTFDSPMGIWDNSAYQVAPSCMTCWEGRPRGVHSGHIAV